MMSKVRQAVEIASACTLFTSLAVMMLSRPKGKQQARVNVFSSATGGCRRKQPVKREQAQCLANG